MDLNDQVLTRKDWLPEDLFPGLDELRAEHHELVAELENAGHLAAQIRKQYEDEDAARKAAVAAGGELPPVTGSAERNDRLEEARLFVQARVDRLAEFVERALALINEKGAIVEFPADPGSVPEWRALIASQLAEVDAEIEAARALVAAAEAKEAAIKGKERWLNMTVKGKGGRYLAASQIPPVMTREEWDADKVPPSMSGMVVG